MTETETTEKRWCVTNAEEHLRVERMDNPDYARLKPEVKEMWLADLPNRIQTKASLKREVDGEFHYCCLGVLSEIAVREGILEPSFKDDRGGVHSYLDAEQPRYDFEIGETVMIRQKMDAMPPVVCRDWAGLPEDVARDLASMNDDDMTFAEIGAWIEENL
jgi:hypothetical protein